MPRFRNSASRSVRLRAFSHFTLASALVLLWSTTGGAQGFGPDPFHPYNSDYSQFVWPITPSNDYGYSSQTIRGLRSANQFQSYMNSLQNPGTNPSGRGGPGTPYYRANRKYDKDFGRVYEPNKNADKDFDTYKEQSTELYFKYLREKDPRRRAELFRQYNRARVDSDRALSSGRNNNRPGTRSQRLDGIGSGTGERANARERDLLGAPPLSSDRSRDRSADRLRGRSGGTASGSSIGPAPSPLGGSDSSSSAGMGHAPTPADVLERALRSERERSRISPRRRNLGTASPGPPPPTP